MLSQIFIASSNRNKITELQNLFPLITFVTPSEYPDYCSPEENQDTFAGNALLKARYGAKLTDLATLADDSGLSVSALAGEPGIYSARYASDWAAMSKHQNTDINTLNMRKLLHNMQFITNRQARFVCALTVCLPDGRYCQVEADWQGEIATGISGKAGFGYDPIFIPEGYATTVAHFSAAQKNQLSHRGKALQLLQRELVKKAWLPA